VIVYTEPRSAHSPPRGIDASCPDLPGEPRRANSQRILREVARPPRAPFANGSPFTQSASFPCLRFQLSTVDCRPLLGSRRAPKAQKRAPVTPLFATLTHSLSRKSFACHSYANTRGVGIPTSIFRSRFGTPDSELDTKSPGFCALAYVAAKSFRIRSYEKCARNSFRIRSYKIPWGVEPPSHPLAPLRPTEGTATKVSSHQSADTSSATRAYLIHPMSIARSGV
jgi:hypothetical protein